MLLNHALGHQDSAAKFLGRLDDMVGRRHQHGALGIVPGDQRRPQSDARRRVSPHRFADVAYPACWWRGRDGIDRAALRSWFPAPEA